MNTLITLQLEENSLNLVLSSFATFAPICGNRYKTRSIWDFETTGLQEEIAQIKKMLTSFIKKLRART